jgi:hypothetical protein
MLNPTEGIPPTTIREVGILRKLKHPNVVALLDVFYRSDQLTLVFEFLERDLKSFLDGHRRFLPCDHFIVCKAGSPADPMTWTTAGRCPICGNAVKKSVARLADATIAVRFLMIRLRGCGSVLTIPVFVRRS